MSQQPTIGRIVHYTLSEHDAAAINKRRKDAKNLNAAGVTLASQQLGAQIHVGNEVRAGEQYPAIIVRVFEAAKAANLRVWLDGNDDYWACSVGEGEGGRHWNWPPRF
jgi:transcriptional regulator